MVALETPYINDYGQNNKKRCFSAPSLIKICEPNLFIQYVQADS